jgi:hypothetical protein
MIPGENVLKANRTRNPQVSTTAFLRAGGDTARGLVFRGTVNGSSVFNQQIDADRWPVTRSEAARIQASVTPAQQYPVIPSAVQASIPFRAAATAVSAVRSVASAAYNMMPQIRGRTRWF